MEDSGEVHNKQIHELTEIYDESSGFGRRSTNSKARQQVVMIDGRGTSATNHRAKRSTILRILLTEMICPVS